MSRSSIGFRRSFSAGRKISRDNRKNFASQQHGTEHNELHEKRQRSRHDNSDSEKAARSIFGDVPLTDTERRYLWAAQSGNLPALELLLQEDGTFNLSCRDYLGRTALQLAVLGEHYDCIELLLEKSRLDVIEEGLLHAINTENVKICDMFLSHPVYSDQRSRMQMEFQHGFYEQEDSSSSFAPDITPIVLAAQCNNFDIVHMLIQKGFTISTPHNYFCLCTECYNHKNFDRVVHSKSRLNAYRGLASTAYLCLSCDDPIYAAFELSRSLQKLADREKEHKNEYRGLSDKCKNFAVDLLDHCRTNEEVMAALHGGTDTRDLSRIKMAIRYEQKKFISHASCQEHLASIWYSGVSWFQHQNFPVKLIMVPCGVVFIPVTAIIYVFLPYSRIGKILKSPFMKFMNYICSYTAFLVLLFLGTQLSSFRSSHLFMGTEGVVNGLIMFYVLGMFWAECKQLWEEGVRGYFAQMWNYMDITMLALYTAGYSTEAVIYTKTQGYASHILHNQDETVLSPQILSKVLFSVANVMSFARIAYILPASETFGQLQISYGRMLQDVGKFIFIYFTVMIAFICGLTSLYSICKNGNFAGLLETTGTLFWAAFGMGNSKAPEIPPAEADDSTDEFQITDKEHLAVIEIVGYILYGVYILGAVVVLINMLIAMMSNTFEDIQKSEDCEWKFARAKLWISFIEQGTTLPIPFNIIPTPKSALKIIRWLNECICCGERNQNTDWQSFKLCDQKYKAIMHRVVLRYIHKMKFEKKGESLKDEILDTREEVIYQLHSVYGRLAARLELLEKDVFALSRSGVVCQEGPPSPAHSSLSYSRSVPVHTRDGDSSWHCLSDQPRASYLQRRRSYYHERRKPEMPEDSGRSHSTTDSSNTRSCLSKHAVYECDSKSKREPSALQALAHNTVTTVTATTSSGNKCGDDQNHADLDKVNMCPDENLPARRGSYRLRQSLISGPGTASDRRTRGEQCKREDSLRHSRGRDGCSHLRRTQGIIKESSLEDQMNTSGDKETSFSCGSQTGSVKQSQELYNHPDVEAQVGMSCGLNSRRASPECTLTSEQDEPNKQENVTCFQQVPSFTLNFKLGQATSSRIGSLIDSQGEQTSMSNQKSPPPFSEAPNTNERFNAYHGSLASGVNENTSSDCSSKCSTSIDHCAIKVSTTPRTSNMCPDAQGNQYVSSLHSRTHLQRSDSGRKLYGILSPVTLDNVQYLPTIPGRKIGHVSHMYIPESRTQDSTLDSASNEYEHGSHVQSSEPIFYTRESRESRYTPADLHISDNADSFPEDDSANQVTVLRRDRSAPVSNKQTLFYLQMLSDNPDKYALSPTHNFPAVHFENIAPSTRLNTTPDRNTGSPINAGLLRDKPELEASPTNTRLVTESRMEDTDSVRQYHEYSSYQRPSPLRKHESVPVIVLSNKSLRIHPSGHEDHSQYPTPSSGRYQRYNTYDLKVNPTPDDINKQYPMAIPAMATNLRPFLIPTQTSDVLLKKQLQPQQHSSDSDHAASSDSNKKESPKSKSSRLKKTSIVSFVRGRKSQKKHKSDIKHSRSLSMGRCNSGSRSDRLRTFHSQRSKEV